MNQTSKLVLSIACVLAAAGASANPPATNPPPADSPSAKSVTDGHRSASLTRPRPASQPATVAPAAAVAAAAPGSAQQINPQPLPPKVWGGSPGGNVSINPQPLPPKDWGTLPGAGQPRGVRTQALRRLAPVSPGAEPVPR